MAHNCLKALVNGVSFAIIFLTSQASVGRVAWALEPLPADIPPVEVRAEESVGRAAAAIERINDPEERLLTLSRAIYNLRSLGRPKLSPLLALAEREAMESSDNRLVILDEPLAIVDPELLFKLCDSIKDERVRDTCLYYYARGGARQDLTKARRIVAEIKDPARRASALVNIIYSGQFTLPELKGVLTEIHALGWPESSGARPYPIGYALVKMPPENFPEVVAFIQEEFKPDEAVLTLCHMAGQYSYFQKRPELAKRALAAAAELVSNCDDRAAAVKWILHYRYAQFDREHAAALFHEHVVPLAKRQGDQQGEIRGLAAGGIDFALSHAKRAAEELGIPEDRLVHVVLRAAADYLVPEELLAWLNGQPATRTREAAMGCFARGLAERTRKTAVDPTLHQKWVDLLSAEAVKISDPALRREACEAIFRLTRYPRSKAKIIVPLDLKVEYARLWERREELPAGNALAWNMSFHLGLHSDSVQEEEIRRLDWERKTRAAAARLRDSSLDGKTKKDWYDRLLDQARAVPDKGQRAAVLSGIATCLEDERPADAIDVLWESLQLVKPYHKSEAWNHDVGDELGDVLAPSNPDEALSSMYLDFRGGGQPAINALWAFAHKLDAADEREPLLEALAKVLVVYGQTTRAAGVTTLLSDPARQARVWMEVARQLHGVKDENR